MLRKILSTNKLMRSSAPVIRWQHRSIVLAIASGLVAISLSGCAKTNLKTPCPDFGKWCTKTPINSWTYQGN